MIAVRSRAIRTLCAIALWFLVAVSSSTVAATFFAAPWGADSNSGSSPDSPWTLNKAVRSVTAGDVIELRGGLYVTGGQTIPTQGTAAAPVLMRPFADEEPIIDAGGVNDPSAQTALYFYRDDFAPQHWVLEDLEIRGGYVYAVKIDTGNVTLRRCRIHDSGRDAVKIVSTADDVLIEGNEIYNTGMRDPSNAEGIDNVGADRMIVRDNYIHDIATNGIYPKGNAREAVIERNVFRNIGSRGIQVGGSTGVAFLNDGSYESYDTIVRNNLVLNTQSACISVVSSYNAKIYNNSCYNTAILYQGALYVSNESELGQANTLVDVRNNIFHVNSTRYMVRINGDALTAPETLSINNNLYWNTNGTADARFNWEDFSGLGWTNWSFGEWQAATGRDADGLNSDPAYDSASVLTLASNSPAIDAGDTVADVTTDFHGSPRPRGPAYDIGAYEVGAALRYDFDADGRADVLWRRPVVGTTWLHFMDGLSVSSEAAGPYVAPDWSLAGVGDFDADRKADLMWRRANGVTWFYLMDGAAIGAQAAGPWVGPSWSVAGTGDLDGDGDDDIVWRRNNGATWLYLMNGATVASQGAGNVVGMDWTLEAVRDFDGDGKADFFWRRNNGASWFYFMDGLSIGSEAGGPFVGTDWAVAGTGDLDGDGKQDIVWRRANGALWYYLMDGAAIKAQGAGPVVAPDWSLAAVRDLDGDGKDDTYWRRSNGATWIYLMDGMSIASEGAGPSVATDWVLVAP